MQGFTMKKLLILLSCALIIGSAQLSAMKRDNSHITTAPQPVQAPWLPGDIITKIAATCDLESQANLSLISKWFNQCASIKNNPAIVNQPEFEINGKNRLYYLFYGCIHNLKNLVNKALQNFDPEKKKNNWYGEEYYPDKQILHEAKYQIDQCIKTDTCKLLPCYSDIERSRSADTIFDLAGSNNDAQLFNLCIKNPQFNHLNAMPSCIAKNLDYDPALFCKVDYQNTDENWTKEQFVMLKILLMHNRYSTNQLCYHYSNNEPCTLPLWTTPSLTAAKLFLDYDTVNDINRHEDEDRSWAPTLLHTYLNLPNTIKLLLTYPKIDVNIQDTKGRTPLHRAARGRDSMETAKILLAHPDINVNLQDDDGNTPLHDAIDRYDDGTEIIKLLLADPRTDVNLQNNGGDTPLHTAAKSKYDWEKASLLLAHPKINLSMFNIKGISPIQCMINTEQSFIYDLNNGTSDTEKNKIEQKIIKIRALIDKIKTLIEQAQIDSYFT